MAQSSPLSTDNKSSLTPAKINQTNEWAVHRTFQIPEMFESILLQMHPLDLIRAEQVNSAWSKQINQSSNIKRRCGILRTRHFYSAFEVCRDSVVAAGSQPIEVRICDPWETELSLTDKIDPSSLAIKYQMEAAFDAAVAVDPRARDMLLCSPPLQNMALLLHTRLRNDAENLSLQQKEVLISAPDGIKVAHIMEAVEEFQVQMWGKVPKSSEVQTWACTYGEVGLDLVQDDPLLVARRKKHEELVRVAGEIEKAEAEEKAKRDVEIAQMAQAAQAIQSDVKVHEGL